MEAHPLTWPVGWKRSGYRTRSSFGAKNYSASFPSSRIRELSIAEATERVLGELRRMGVSTSDIIISTNLRLRGDGLPLSKQKSPEDPGVAVYWKKGKRDLVMAIDRYDRIADNLAAVAATIEAMRMIERHGGAEILDRSFTGFAALPAPVAAGRPWRDVLGVGPGEVGQKIIKSAYLRKRGEAHPDRQGGEQRAFLAVQAAYEEARREIGFDG